MASQEECATFTWELRNFGVLLKLKKGQLYSPNYLVEDAEGKELRSFLVADCFNSRIEFFVHGFDSHSVRFQMSFISYCGDVLLKADRSRSRFGLAKSALFDKNRQSILLNDTMTLCCKAWGKKLMTSEFHRATVLHSLYHPWTIEKPASSDYHDTYFEQEIFKFHVSLKKNRNGDWNSRVEEKQCAPEDRSIVDFTLSVKDSCGRVLNHQKPSFCDSHLALLRFDIDSNVTGVTLQLELIVAFHETHELPASSQVVRETPLKPNSPTNIARDEFPSSSQVARETPLKPNSPTNIASHELSASSQVTMVTPLKPNSPAKIARHELPASSQIVKETPLKPKSPTNIARHELPASSQVSRVTSLKPNSPAKIARHELPASSQVAMGTPPKPNSPTNIARHELPASSQVVRETPLKRKSPSNIAQHELSASSQVAMVTPLKPNSPAKIARHELPASLQVVRETPLKLNSPTKIARYELPASSQVSRVTPPKPISPSKISKHELPAFLRVSRVTRRKPNSPTKIARHELPASSQVSKVTPLKPNSPKNITKHNNVSGALSDDFLLLYRESVLSDVTLNTEGKSFSVHRTVLAARSPVFRAMFEKDEDRSREVDIGEVDSETADRMLVYLYSDSVGDLAWKEALALYYAADKYEILPLKEKCADFLKAGMAADNACDVLVLADRHSDQKLMARVVNFNLDHEEVVSSAQWKELEKGNPMLCAKIAIQLFLKKGEKK